MLCCRMILGQRGFLFQCALCHGILSFCTTAVAMTMAWLPPTSLVNGSNSPASSPLRVEFVPSRVTFHHVFKQYPPPNWQQSLFSSVPVREYALFDIDLSFEPGQLVLLQGASSSGKSTMLQAIYQSDNTAEFVTKGQVDITSGNHTACSRTTDSSIDTIDSFQPLVGIARPVYLDERPSQSRSSLRTVVDQECWKNIAMGQKVLRKEETKNLLLDNMARLVGFETTDDWDSLRPYDLSPSENYRFALLLACLQSSFHTKMQPSAVQFKADATGCLQIPAPIVLLDEWMDKETSVVIQNVQSVLWNLVRETGAVVCSISHKGERWNRQQMHRTITLSGGKVLSIQVQKAASL